MADRYWVGGTGTWNTSTTTNWSATSGGAGGASAPTTADNVFFDANSGTGTVTLSGATTLNNLDCTGFSGTFTGTGQKTLYGTTFTLSATMTMSATNVWSLVCATSSSVSITTAGKTLQTLQVGNNSNSATVFNFIDDVSVTATLSTSQGTINTNGVTINAATLNPSQITTVNFGNSTINLSSGVPLNITVTSFIPVLNFDTSTINCTSIGATFRGAGYTFYNVNFTDTTSVSTQSIEGANTFNNLTVYAASGTKLFNFVANQTINGTLTTSGTTATSRIQFGSSVAGTQRTITIGSAPTPTNVNLKDLAFTGAAAPWTAAVGVWNLGNNSGVTFTGTTYYWIGAAGTWTTPTKWSLSSGGAAANAIPGPDDNVVFDANSTGTGSMSAATVNTYCKNFDATNCAFALIIGGPNHYVYGDFIGSSTLNVFGSSGSTNLYFVGTTNLNVPNTNISSMTYITTGNVTLTGNLRVVYGLNMSGGSLNTNSYNIGDGVYGSTAGVGTNAFTMSGGTLTLGSSIFGTYQSRQNFTITGGTVSAGTSKIWCGNFAGNGNTFYDVRLSSASSISGANTFNDLQYSSGSLSVVTLQVFANQTVNGTLTLSGYDARYRLNIDGALYSGQKTISAATTSLSNVNFYGINATGAAAWTGTSIGDSGYNSGSIVFDAPKTVYWNYVAGGAYPTFAWNPWALTSGGATSIANSPLPQDSIIFDDTGLTSGNSVTISGAFGSVSASSRTLPMSLGFFGKNVGDVALSSVITMTSAISVYKDLQITQNSAALRDLYIAYGAVSLPANLTLGSGYSFYLGTYNAAQTDNAYKATINLNGYTLTAWRFLIDGYSGNANGTGRAYAAINFGTNGVIEANGYDASPGVLTGSPGQSVSGTGYVYLSYSGAVTTNRLVRLVAISEANTFDLRITGDSSPVWVAGGDTHCVKSFTAVGASNINGSLKVFGNFDIPATGGSYTALGVTMAATSGTKTFTTNGRTSGFDYISFNGVGGTWQFLSAFTTSATGYLDLTAGTIDLNGFNLSLGYLSSNNTNTRAINFGSNSISLKATSSTCLGIATATGFTYTGTPTINVTGAASAGGARTVNFGGSGGATESNVPNVSITSGSDTITVSGGYKNLNVSHLGSLANTTLTIYGNYTIGTNVTPVAGTSATTFAATSGTNTITTNGKTLDFPITFNGVGGTWQLAGNLTVGATRTVTLTNGTLDTNSKTVTSGVFLSNNSNVRTLTLGSTVWSLASTGSIWDCATTTNMTLNAGTSEIILSSTSTTARTFAGGGLTYNKVTIGGATGTSTTTITGSNVFGTLASTKVVAHTISITSSTTQTIGTWSINGTAGNVVTLGSTSTANHTLTKTGGGTVTANYMSISKSTATPTLTWLATNSTNGGGNVGWYFGSFLKGNTLFFGSNF